MLQGSHLHLLSSGLTDRAPCPCIVSVSSGHPNSSSHACQQVFYTLSSLAPLILLPFSSSSLQGWLLQTSVQGNDGGSEGTDCLRKRDLRPSGCPVRTCLLVFFEPALLRGSPDLVLSPRSRTKKHSAPRMLGLGQLCSLCLVWEGTLVWSKRYLETLRTQSLLWPREPD